jgi:pimeloyl-ACP methyl ester carboxylesterase
MRISYVIILIGLLIAGCQKSSFTKNGQANDQFFLKSGNIELPITVAGNVDAKKFLVIVHGGPGGNGLDYRDSYAMALAENKCAVVYWDQRFAGNSQGNNGATDISAFRQDIKNILLLLKAQYGQDIQIYLMGHSWGGFLTPYFLVEGNNQSLVKGWIQVDGAHNYRMNDSLTREMLISTGKQEIAAGRRSSDWQPVVDWCMANGFEGNDNAGQLNGYAHKAEEWIPAVTTPSNSTSSGGNNAALLSHWINERASGYLQLDGPAYTTPISDQLHLLKLPTLLLWGQYDFVCPLGLSNDIEKHCASTNLTKIIYEHSGHSPMVNEPVKFWEDVLAWMERN